LSIVSNRAGALASYACALLTVAALVVGISIAVQLGAHSGVDVARADAGSLSSIKPVLATAEWLKIVTGALIAIAVRAAQKAFRPPLTALIAGLAGAALLLGAGIMGLFALAELGRAGGGPELGRWTAMLGLASAPLTGIWAACLFNGQTHSAPRWLCIAGLVLAGAGLVALLVPPVGLLFGLTSIAWWLGLGRLLGKMHVD